jgi:hypothetical protein
MKNKIVKILGLVVTLATLMSLFVSAAPVSAATQEWSQFATPSAAGMVLNTTISAGGPIEQSPVDGALYVYVNDGGTHKLLKSTDSGRTWKVSGSVGQPVAAVVAIACSPTEANVVFYTDGTTLWKSVDGGANFLPIVNVTGAAKITALDIAKWGGRYIAVVGTNGLGTMTAGVYYWDESLPFNNLTPVGTTEFGYPVLDVAMAPTFSSDRAVVAIGVKTLTDTIVRVDVNGGAWGAIVPDYSTATASAAPTAADIAFPSDFNATTSPIYFYCVSDADATEGGVFRMIGNVPTQVQTTVTCNNMSISGSFASGTAALLAGTSAGTAFKSTDAGFTWTSVTLRSNVGVTAWVLLDKDYATSKKAYILNVGGPGAAFNVSIDGMAYFNQWSLINETIASIVDLAIASNGDMFMITGAGNNIWRYYGSVWERVACGITGDMIRVSPNYATDKGVVYALKGSDNAIVISTNNGNRFANMSSKPGSITAPANKVYSLWVIDASTFVVGSDAGIITRNSGAFWWTETSPFGAGTVTDIDASGSVMVAVACDGTVVKVAKSTDAGATWTTLKQADGATVASISSAATAAHVAVSGTGEIFVALSTGGVYRYSAGTFIQVDDDTYDVAGDVFAAVGLVAGVSGDVSATEGAGMIYAADSSDGVSRIRGLATEAENLAVATPSGLWLTRGSGTDNVLWVTSVNKIFTYTDTLNVAGSGLAQFGTATYYGTAVYGLDPGFPLGFFSAVVKWNALPNAREYAVYFSDDANDPGLYDLYAADAAGFFNVTSQTQQTITPLVPNATYYVSVWAVTEQTPSGSAEVLCSSFLFNKQPITLVTPPAVPNWTPNLSPMSGAQNVQVGPTPFDWDDVLGATGYEFQIAEGTDIPSGTATTTLTTSQHTIANLKNSTFYTWRVRAVTGSVKGDWVTSVFSTAAATQPPVTITQTAQPAPSITLTVPQPSITLSQPAITVTIPPGTTTAGPTLVLPEAETPAYIWIIVAVGGVLTIAVIVLIVRTRRVV